MVTNQQVNKLMDEMNQHGNLTRAALKAGMDRKTARRYLRSGKLPSEAKPDRTWRTRPDPFEEDWPDVVRLLEDDSALEAKTIFEDLQARFPGRYQEGQLRTLQRRIREWRATFGPDKRVFFSQAHRPGEAMQTDFTHANSLSVTIRGERFDHRLCHSVLPYSNWESVSICRSESMLAIKRGVQQAIWRLGRTPEYHQTDHSTAATHKDLGASGSRAFNADYEALCSHYGMTPRTTGVGQKEQNGDVEALNGALKRKLDQRLRLRCSRDFDSIEDYESWLWDQCRHQNRSRTDRLNEELAVMTAAPERRLPEFVESRVRVNRLSTIRVRGNAYSVPSRLIGSTVQVRQYEDRIEVFFAGQLQVSVSRLIGTNQHRINYRHVITSLVAHPGAFPRYSYRADMFPSVEFRRAYDALSKRKSARSADLNYLRILKLAAMTTESGVVAALTSLMESGKLPTFEAVEALIDPPEVEVPEVCASPINLAEFNDLLDDLEMGA